MLVISIVLKFLTLGQPRGFAPVCRGWSEVKLYGKVLKAQKAFSIELLIEGFVNDCVSQPVLISAESLLTQ